MKNLGTFAIVAGVLMLSLATAGLAADAPPPSKELMSPEQAAMSTVQQQRNQAEARAADLQATLAYLQAQMARDRKYWADYVGEHPAQPTPATPPPAPQKK